MFKRFISAGVVCFGLILMGVNVAPAPEPEINIDIEPSRIAGASVLPLVDYRTVPIKTVEQEVSLVADPVSEPIPEPVAETEPTELVNDLVNEPVVETTVYGDELDLLYRTVQAEGYTMGFEGMQYITDSILNLARSRGCSVTEVITSGAYTVVNNGTIWRQSIYDDTIAAVNAEVDGSQLNYDIKYFRTNHYHGFGTPEFHYGNVYFNS